MFHFSLYIFKFVLKKFMSLIVRWRNICKRKQEDTFQNVGTIWAIDDFVLLAVEVV